MKFSLICVQGILSTQDNTWIWLNQHFTLWSWGWNRCEGKSREAAMM